MKAVKRFFIGVFVIALLVVVVSFFLPTDVHVERSKVMNVTPDQAYALVSDLEQWPSWMPWLKLDPTMEISYGEKTVGAGASYSWVSQNPDVGSGTLTIKEAVENESMNNELAFEGMGTSMGSWKFEAVEGGTKVTWALDADMSSPFLVGPYLGLFMDGMVGGDFERGLSSIDSLLQLAPPAPAYTIDITQEDHAAYNYLAVTDSCELHQDTIGAHYGTAFGAVMMHIMTSPDSIQMAGMPFSITNKWDPESGWYWFTAGIPVDTAITGTGMISSGVAYAGPVVKGIHVGPYGTMEASHDEVYRYIQENGMTMAGDPWEVFIDDPTTVDESELRTFIYYPVLAQAQ